MSNHPTPGFLRGSATNQIVGIMHTAAERGPWALESAHTYCNGAQVVVTTLSFVVGTPESFEEEWLDNRPRVTITIGESSGK